VRSLTAEPFTKHRPPFNVNYAVCAVLGDCMFRRTPGCCHPRRGKRGGRKKKKKKKWFTFLTG